MPMKLSEEEVKELQIKYYYLTNYQSENIDDPIEPLTYVDSNGDNLLHIATCLGDLKTVELLLKAGLDVNQLGDMGCTALHYAKIKNKNNVYDLLLSHGASKNIRNEFGKLPEEC
jgi:ankyrin repeat protein